MPRLRNGDPRAASVGRGAGARSRSRAGGDGPAGGSRAARALGGMALLTAIVAVMWILEVINSLDSGGLDSDGIWPRNPERLWGILTAPFLHASWGHLIGNTVPLVFMGVIVALRGAARLALVTAIVIVVGGLGTWLISPGGLDTIGASGVVFGYATYLLARGLFDRSLLELATGVIVGVVWGGALLSSLAPQPGVSWQAHLCGGLAGILAAWLLAGGRRSRRAAAARAARAPRAV